MRCIALSDFYSQFPIPNYGTDEVMFLHCFKPILQFQSSSLGQDSVVKMSYIGAFDSGLGGLSIFRALHQHLPKERFTFLADSRHFPYGEKSKEVLHPIFNNNVDLFQDSKGIVIACNTMSCFLDVEKNHKPPIFSIIDCMVTTVQKYYKDIGALGIMGTDYTVRSETYLNYFKRIGHSYPIYQVAGTKLAPAVENDDENVWEICQSYID